MRFVSWPAELSSQNCQTSGRQPVMLSAAMLLLMPALTTCISSNVAYLKAAVALFFMAEMQLGT